MSMDTAVEYDHELKVWPAYFAPLSDGRKSFEVRRDDRGFQRGDVLRLREYEPDRVGVKYTGNACYARIEWILTGGQFGVEPGFVVMAIQLLEDDE